MDVKDNFMKVFKYYKSNNPKPSFEHVICLDEGCSNKLKVVKNTVNISNIADSTDILGLKSHLNWNIVSFLNHPGLIFIRNPFTTLGQRYWIRKCLEEYPKKPNKLNLDNEIYLDDWWEELCLKEGSCIGKFHKKLRWTTLGYHHNWDSKEYSEENKNEFPQELAHLCEIISKVLGFVDFKAEAAIINYYHMGSTLSAHTDHSEINLDAPLFSFSFGQSAIFLIGGTNRLIEPSAILLNSGDILVMSKEARLCYHAVPRILKSANQPWNDDCDLDSESLSNIGLTEDMKRNIKIENWSAFSKYVEESRINMNVRQVLNKNQYSLNNVMY